MGFLHLLTLERLLNLHLSEGQPPTHPLSRIYIFIHLCDNFIRIDPKDISCLASIVKGKDRIVLRPQVNTQVRCDSPSKNLMIFVGPQLAGVRHSQEQGHEELLF